MTDEELCDTIESLRVDSNALLLDVADRLRRCVVTDRAFTERSEWQSRALAAEKEVERLREVIRAGGAGYRAERSAMGIAGGIDPDEQIVVRRPVEREVVGWVVVRDTRGVRWYSQGRNDPELTTDRKQTTVYTSRDEAEAERDAWRFARILRRTRRKKPEVGK